MKSLLIIDSDTQRANALCERFATHTFSIETAPDGFYALTMLERNRPELIMVRSKLTDMNAGEFCAILKHDRTLSHLPVALLAESPESAEELTLEASFSFVLVDPQDQILKMVLPELPELELLQVKLLVLDLAVAASGGSKDEAMIHGSNSFWQLVEVLTTTGKSGRLILEPNRRNSYILFREGRILAASFEGAEGRQALAAMLYAIKKNRHQSFELEDVSEEEFESYPPDSGITAIQLLREVERGMAKNNTLELKLPPGYIKKMSDEGN